MHAERKPRVKFEEVASLVADVATEGQSLEFKSGRALSRDGGQPAAIVKAAIGMANAAGGRIIYGIGEHKHEGIRAAVSWEPVTDSSVDAEWVTQIIKSHSAPPLQRFDVQELAIPAPVGQGRIFVVDVEAASTAHQSTFDHKYYQRGAKSTMPMLDSQIRDVMGRRTAPVIDIQIIRGSDPLGASTHAYSLTPQLTNKGLVSLEKWLFEIEMPSDALDLSVFSAYISISRTSERIDGCIFTRLRIPSAGPGIAPAAAQGLYPSQSIRLDGSLGIPVPRLLIDTPLVQKLQHQRPPIRWRLFMPNAMPTLGELAFEAWCAY